MFANAEHEFFEPILLEDLVGNGYELPSLPQVYLRVSAQLDDPECSIEQIGNTIQNDPSITSRILKLVNSGYLGTSKDILSVVEAVEMLGRERCKHILIGSVVRGVFGAGENPAFSMQAFWEHSIRTALIARHLASECPLRVEPEVMFTAGLLHDVGKLLLIERFPNDMLAAEEIMIRRRIDQVSSELAQLGVTHTAVGEALMLHWGMPDLLVDCVRFHHEAVHDGPHRQATHLVYLANRLGEYQPPLDEDETRAILEDIENWNMNPITTEQIAYACQVTDELVFEVMESLGMVTVGLDDD